MKTRIVEGKAIKAKRRSKYDKLLGVMAESLRRNGADGKLRAVEGSEAWAHYKVRRIAAAVRARARTHKTPGFRLSVGACTINGLTFRWIKARPGARP